MNITYSEIAKLTWKQIIDGYFHERDEHGEIVFPKAPPIPIDEQKPDGSYSFEFRFTEIQRVMWSGMLPRNDYIKLVTDLCKEYDKPLPVWWENYIGPVKPQPVSHPISQQTPQPIRQPKKSRVIKRGKM